VRVFVLAEGERMAEKVHKDSHSSFLRKKEKIVYLPIV